MTDDICHDGYIYSTVRSTELVRLLPHVSVTKLHIVIVNTLYFV